LLSKSFFTDFYSIFSQNFCGLATTDRKILTNSSFNFQIIIIPQILLFQVERRTFHSAQKCITLTTHATAMRQSLRQKFKRKFIRHERILLFLLPLLKSLLKHNLLDPALAVFPLTTKQLTGQSGGVSLKTLTQTLSLSLLSLDS
jgi:hypothetical protein